MSVLAGSSVCFYVFMHVCQQVCAYVCVFVCKHLEQVPRGEMEGSSRNVYTLSSLHLKPVNDNTKTKSELIKVTDTTLRLHRHQPST